MTAQTETKDNKTNEQMINLSSVAGFAKTSKARKTAEDPKTYIHYRRADDPEGYNLVRTLRAQNINVEALVKHLLKQKLGIKDASETEKKGH